MIKKIFSPPSLKLNVMVVIEVVTLLVASLAVLFYYSYKTLKDEAMKDAVETLDGVALNIDNVLMSVEQSAGNIYYNMVEHLNEPDRMETYCRELLACNPYVQGCAVAFKPGFYQGHERFMVYVHHKDSSLSHVRHSSQKLTANSQQLIANTSDLVVQNSFGTLPYTEHVWYSSTMATGRGGWVGPLREEEDVEITITFCLPLSAEVETADGKRERQVVGVFAVDMADELLSEIVLSAKPSPNSYCVLLGNKGEYIIHPNKEMVEGHSVFDRTEGNPELLEIAQAMVAGETGSKAFSLDGNDYFKFYKPFVRTGSRGRTMEELHWSVGLIYPVEDFFGVYRNMFLHVLTVAVVAVLVFFLLCRIVFSMHLKPLRELTESAQRIADGHYDDPMSDSNRNDEIGQFQQHFQEMQKALAARVSELQQMGKTLREHSEELRKTHEQVERDEQVRATLLHNVTSQMIAPSEAIVKSVKNLCDNYQTISLEEANNEVNDIKHQSETIIAMLNKNLNDSGNEEGGTENA
jgi:HAMP domain-containing protein